MNAKKESNELKSGVREEDECQNPATRKQTPPQKTLTINQNSLII